MEKDKVIENFINSVNELGLELSQTQTDQFNKFYDLLIEKNSVMNLTRITEFDEVYFKHFYDSLSILSLQNIENKSIIEYFQSGINILDLGTGAGFPGMPLKIAFPEINITFADSVNKKLKFIYESCLEIFKDEISDNPFSSTIKDSNSDSKHIKFKDGFGNINIIHGRAEDLGHEKFLREKYDLVLSRAVANLSTLSEYCLPFTKINGHFISYKSSDSLDEINSASNAIKILGGSRPKTSELSLPFDYGDRILVDIKKVNNTKSIYPRKAGTPSKNPL